MKKLCFASTILFLLFLYFVSCTNDVDIFNLSDEIKVDQPLVIPIGKSYATSVDILKRFKHSDMLVIDSTSNELYFEKYDTIVYRYRNLNLESKIYPLSVEYPLNTGLLPKIAPANSSGIVSGNSSFSSGINDNASDDRIDSLHCQSLTLSCNLSLLNISIPISKIKVKIIPNAHFKFGDSDNDTITLTPTAYDMNEDIVLDNAKLYFPNGSSSISLNTEIYYSTGGSDYILYPNAKIIATYTIKKIDYRVAFGYFNPENYSNPTETNTLDYFGFLPPGYLRFANPQLSITASNNIGTHLIFRFDYVRAYLSYDLDFLPIYASFDGQQSFSQPVRKPAPPGSISLTTMRTIDKNFGHTYLLFDSLQRPDVFEYQFTSLLDKDRINEDKTPNFLIPDSKINLYLHSKLSLYFNEGSFYESNDTSITTSQIDATFKNKLRIDTCQIVLKVKNAFPCQIATKVQMLDSLNRPVLNSLAREHTVLSASVDEDGTVVEGRETNQVIKILVEQEHLDELKSVRKFITNVKITGKDGTDSNKKIHLTQDNFVDVKVGLYVKFNTIVTIND
ncbi:MAG: hypothetical protein ACK5L7_05925 [Paludibacteraceae bacterium]